jgi:predicted exporter
MRARRVAVVVWLGAILACIGQITQTRFVADLSSFLPASPAPEQRFLVEQLKSGAVARVMLVGIEGGDAAKRAAVSRALAERLRSDPQFASVNNGTGSGIARERELIFRHRYALSPRVSADHFGVEGLRAAIAETIDLLASPAGLLVKQIVTRDPTGETLAIVNALEASEGPPMEEGVWASGGRTLLVAMTRAGAADIDAQARAAARVEAIFREVAGDSGTRVVMTGAGVFSARSRALIEHDVVRLTTTSALIVTALLLLVYRSGVALALGLVPVVTGALAGIAAVSLGFGVVHGITLGFGATLIGEAVDYAIYLFVQAEGADPARHDEWLARFWPTIRLGVLTSCAGFLALLLSGLPGLAQLGLYSIAGLLAAAAVTRFVLPSLLPAGFRIRDVSALGARLEGASAWAARGRAGIAVLALLAAIALASRYETLWDAELASLNPIPATDRALDAELRKGLGAADARFLVAVPAPSDEAALQGVERIGAQLDALAAAGRIGGYNSPARILPSHATQRARLESLPDATTLRARLREALAPLPLRPEKLDPFIADLERMRSFPPLTRADLAGTALGAALDALLDRRGDGTWMAVVTLRPPTGARAIDAAAVREAVAQASVPGAVFVDLKADVDRLYAQYFRRAIGMSGVGLLVIVALLTLALRDVGRVTRVLAPLIAAVLVVAAIQALAGTRLTLMHLMGLLLVVAVGSNYALFFERIPAGADPATHRTLASLALANATTVASFGVLALSTIPVLRAIGGTVALGAFVALVFTAAVSGRYNPSQGG